MKRRHLFPILLSLLLLSQPSFGAVSEPSAGPAEAADASPEAPAATRVLVVVIGSAAQLSALRTALGPRALDGAQIEWVSADRLLESQLLEASREGAAVRCFIDLSRLARARLYFSDRRAERFLARELTLAQGLDELGKEALAQVLESSVERLLADQATTLNREQLRSLLAPEPPRAAPRREIAPAPRRAKRTELSGGWGAFYGMRALSADRFSHGPALALRLEVPLRGIGIGAWLSGQYLLPVELSQPVAGVRLTTFAPRLGVGARAVGDSFQFGARLGCGLDVERLVPQKTGQSQLELTDARWVHAGLATAALDAGLRLSSRLWLSASALVDADFRPRHYDLETAGVQRTVLEPWPFRPGAMLGATGTF